MEKIKQEVLSKKQLIEKVAELTESTIKDTQIMLDSFLTIISSEMNKGKKITLSGFGNFIAKTRKERIGINPQTKEKVTYPAKRVPKFIAAKKLKEILEQTGL